VRIDDRSTLEISATPAVCRAAVLDLAAYTAWYPGVTSAELVDDAGPDQTARLVFTTGLPILAEVDCVLRLETPAPDRVRPVTLSDGLRIDGDGWTFAGPPDGPTTATYAIAVEMSVPGGLFTERLVKGKAKHFLIEQPLAALKKHVERPADPDPS
jgi:hypothetical protein